MSDLRIYTTTENKGKFYTNLPSHDVYNESPIQRRGGGRHEHRYHPLSTPANILGPGRNRCSLQKLSRSVRDIIDIPFSYRVINHFPSVTDTPPSVTVKSRNVDKLTVSKYLYTTSPILLFFQDRETILETTSRRNRIFLYSKIEIISQFAEYTLPSPNDNTFKRLSTMKGWTWRKKSGYYNTYTNIRQRIFPSLIQNDSTDSRDAFFTNLYSTIQKKSN